MQTLSSIYNYSLVDQREEAVWRPRGIKPLRIPASVSVRVGTSGGLSKWISRASQLRSPFSVPAGLLFLGVSPVPGQSQLYWALPWSRCPFLENSRVAAGLWTARKNGRENNTCEPWWKGHLLPCSLVTQYSTWGGPRTGPPNVSTDGPMSSCLCSCRQPSPGQHPKGSISHKQFPLSEMEHFLKR